MPFTTDELTLRTLLEGTDIAPEAAVRLVRNAGLSPARAARLLHGLLALPVHDLKATVRQVFDKCEAQQRAEAAQQLIELEALALSEAASTATWPAMTLTNFGVVSSIEVTHNGRAYDLHNDADFQGLQHDVAKRALRLNWGVIGYGTAQVELELLFEDVDHLAVSPRDPLLPWSEDVTLEHIGWLSGGMVQQTTSFQEPSVKAGENMEGAALLFQFRGGLAVVVHAVTVSMTIGPLRGALHSSLGYRSPLTLGARNMVG